MFQYGGRGWPMRCLGTDHVMSGPMRGLVLNCIVRGHTYIHIYKQIDFATTTLD